MFEIDLLKGKARPYKTNLKKVVLRLMLLLIPIGATVVYAVDLSYDRVELSAMQRAHGINESKLEDYVDDMQFLAGLKTRINNVSLLIAEVGQALRYRQVVSPALVEFVEKLPSNVFIKEMTWDRVLRREQKVNEADGSVGYETTIQRSLKLLLYGNEDASSDEAVQRYLSRLEASPIVADVVREIRPAARRQYETDGKIETIYEIQLFLKDQR